VVLKNGRGTPHVSDRGDSSHSTVARGATVTVARLVAVVRVARDSR
jgi:hypothetical protein